MSGNIYPLEPFFGKIISPFERFIKQTTAGGIVLMVMTLLTIIIASSRLGDAYRHIWETPVRFGMGLMNLEMSLHSWVNEGLMALFFLVIGLELKREILVGELASLRLAALPVAGALGGMLVPALIYVAFNPSGPPAAGWGIPMATDIAFSIGILVLLSWRIPRTLIVFLTALAIADDLGAVLVIALFYTKNIDLTLLGIAVGIIGSLILCNRAGIRQTLPYAILGFLLWLALLKSGIHATMSGVILAFTIPARPSFTPHQFERQVDEMSNECHVAVTKANIADLSLETRMYTIAKGFEKASFSMQSPQQRMEHRLSPWVTFGVIPLFAMANAGLDLSVIPFSDIIVKPVTIGVILGLFLGKFFGITGFSWIAVRIGLASLPASIQWKHIMGVAWLGGIGFTMSLFVGQLAFASEPMFFEEAKLGIITASLISSITGLLWLYLISKNFSIEKS
jgi:NhaA family Na+:H+ antiporter